MPGPITIQICRKAGCDDIPLPRYMSAHAAGMDLCAACEQELTIAPGEVKAVGCGFFMALPGGHEAQIRPRSGLALNHGITVANAPGTIDADYRGELQVVLANCSREPYTITRGARFAQLVINQVEHVEVVEVAELSETPREAGGFGHTGH
jgi:dUTP pyrophosphatase